MKQNSNIKLAPSSQYKIMEELKNKFYEVDPVTGANIFQVEYDLIDQMSQRIKSEYGDIFSGKEDNFTAIPSKFHYNKDMTVSIQGLQDRIDKEKSSDKDYNFTPEEIKRMEEELEADRNPRAIVRLGLRIHSITCRKRMEEALRRVSREKAVCGVIHLKR